MKDRNALNPPLALIVKLGSIVAHLDEYLSPHGHPLDLEAAKSGLSDPEVKAWMEAMSDAALLPRRRNPNV